MCQHSIHRGEEFARVRLAVNVEFLIVVTREHGLAVHPPNAVKLAVNVFPDYVAQTGMIEVSDRDRLQAGPDRPERLGALDLTPSQRPGCGQPSGWIEPEKIRHTVTSKVRA
jgi:hypothetical protein